MKINLLNINYHINCISKYQPEAKTITSNTFLSINPSEVFYKYYNILWRFILLFNKKKGKKNHVVVYCEICLRCKSLIDRCVFIQRRANNIALQAKKASNKQLTNAIHLHNSIHIYRPNNINIQYSVYIQLNRVIILMMIHLDMWHSLTTANSMR